MSTKNLDAVISKIVKKVIKKELNKLKQENLPVVSNQTNDQLETFIERLDVWTEEPRIEGMTEEIYNNHYTDLPSKEEAELERQLRELKFKQELRKDWILFLLRDVIVYSATVLFLFAVAGFYLLTLIYRY